MNFSRLLFLVVFIGLALVPGSSGAVQPLPKNWPPAPADVDTSGFALILGGGGARGIAHIGVIEVLEELGMRPSLIVGTSMGSVVGSLYASGWTSAQLKTLALDEDLLQLFVNLEAPPAQMQNRWWGPVPHQFSLKISQWPPLPDTGLSYGQGFESLVGQSTAASLFHARNNFDELPTPFRCVSTDLQNYELVIHGSGSLARAVKASSTIPLIFYPVELDGRHLVDGGFLDNLPVQVARRLGFKRAVLVDVSNVHLPEKEKPDDIYQMWIRVAELYTIFPNDYAVGESDVLLKMPLARYRSFNLESAGDILEIGRSLTLQHRDELIAMRDACGPVARTPAPVAPVQGPVILRSVEVRGLQRMNPGRFLDRLRIHKGDSLEIGQAWQKAEWLTREGSFNTIGFDFQPVGGDSVDVVIHVQEETSPRLELGASIITDDAAAVMARLRQENIFGRGGTALLGTRYSERNALLAASLNQSIDGPGWLAVRARLLWQRELPGLYHSGEEIDQFVFRRQQAGLDLIFHDFDHGWSLYLGGDFGLTNSYLQSRNYPGSGDQDLRTMHITFESHSRELPVARSDRGLRLNHTRSLGSSDGDVRWWRTDLGLVYPVDGLGRWKPVWALGAVASSSNIPVVHQGRAGGPRGWAGLREQEIIAPQFLWTRMGVQYAISPRIYFELAGAIGWYGREDLKKSTPIYGGIIGAGMDSFIGPLRVGFAAAENRPGYLYFQVGHKF